MNVENFPTTMRKSGEDVESIFIRIPKVLYDHPDFPYPDLPADILLTFKGKEIIVRPYIKNVKKERRQKEKMEGEEDGEENQPVEAKEDR